MPQMAPMSWMMLFMFFTLTLIIVMTMNYYLYIPKMSEMEEGQSFTKKKEAMNWKW